MSSERTTFHDLSGHEWPVRITYGTCEDIKRETGIDLFCLFEKSTEAVLSRLFNDISLFSNVTWLAIPESARGDVTKRQFLDQVDGSVMDDASEALMNAIIGLFKDPTKRSAMKRILQKQMNLESEIAERGAMKIESASLEQLLRTSGDGSGSGLERLDAILGLSPTANSTGCTSGE